MRRKIREKINIFAAQSPRKAILVAIMLFNTVFVLLAAGIIAVLSGRQGGLTECNFRESVFRTINMMLDAGCIESVVKDVGQAGTFAVLVCRTVVLVGIVFFSGAVIGYVTNVISDFIESKNNGKNKLLISDHIVIINWNARAAEIINEYLYEKREVKVVVFVADNKDEIDEEIRNRLDTTLIKETQQVLENAKNMPYFEKKRYLRKHLLKDKITYIVREGDVAAATDLDDICISKARTVIILDSSGNGNEHVSDRENGNTQTIKTLIQVSEISKGNDNQTILVEVADSWTEDLVNRIIEFKSAEGKEEIIPVLYNRLLGETYSQIAVMPVLNDVYDNIFSNKSAHFMSRNVDEKFSKENENEYIENHLASNCRSVPMTVMETAKGKKVFYMADSASDIEKNDESISVKSDVKLKKCHVFVKRSIVILGHNSNMDSLMEGLDYIREEQKPKDGSEALSILMVDDEESLASHNFYRDYPYVETLAANFYDEELIRNRIFELSGNKSEEKTILILSDDSVPYEDIDASVLTYLIYIQGQIRRRKSEDPDFRREKLEVVVEVLSPKNEEVVKSYGADRVIISNRYLSHMLSQLSLRQAVYEFYADMISYGLNDGMQNVKELIIIKAEDLFEKLPVRCSAAELIRTVFSGCDENNKSILLGYIRDNKEYVFFTGDQREKEVELKNDDMLMLFGKHAN